MIIDLFERKKGTHWLKDLINIRELKTKYFKTGCCTNEKQNDREKNVRKIKLNMTRSNKKTLVWLLPQKKFG